MDTFTDHTLTPNAKPKIDWSAKLKAASWHLCICLSIALTAYILMSQFWYPNGLLSLAGGLKFFTVLVCCDVVLGPIITLIVYSTRKSKRERISDFAIIGVIQAIALGIGLQAIIEGRPVFNVFTNNKFEIVNAVHIQPEALVLGNEAPFQQLSWRGPVNAIANMPAQGSAEQQLVMDNMMQGYGLAYMPRFYQSLQAPQLQRLQAAIKPISELKTLAPTRSVDIDQALQKAGLDAQSAGWLDVETSSHFGVVIVERATGQTHTFLDIDA